MTKSEKTFVGFGFGPIQSALFLYEAYMSGNFSRFVVAEIDADLVHAVRANNGSYTVNIARTDRIDQFTVEGVEIYNPGERDDREAIIEAVSVSDELATALPSVDIYTLGGDASVASMICEGLARRKAPVATIIYAAENHNRAAEILLESLSADCRGADLGVVQTLNTVIGKMSGVITDVDEIERIALTTITGNIPRAVLVEAFNKILISRIALEGYRRGIEVFVDKDNLLPFEEAKLYGHNAIHALIAYLSDFKGLETVAQAAGQADIMASARAAFIEESGGALIRRYGNLKDPLFTRDGYLAYAEDLLTRMVCPNLNDLVARVGRDHVRKLGYDDRLYGTMRLALSYGIQPVNLALGAAAGVLSMIKRRDEITTTLRHLPETPGDLTEERLATLLYEIWGGRDRVDQNSETLISLTWAAMQGLQDQ